MHAHPLSHVWATILVAAMTVAPRLRTTVNHQLLYSWLQLLLLMVHRLCVACATRVWCLQAAPAALILVKMLLNHHSSSCLLSLCAEAALTSCRRSSSGWQGKSRAGPWRDEPSMSYGHWESPCVCGSQRCVRASCEQSVTDGGICEGENAPCYWGATSCKSGHNQHWPGRAN